MLLVQLVDQTAEFVAAEESLDLFAVVVVGHAHRQVERDGHVAADGRQVAAEVSRLAPVDQLALGRALNVVDVFVDAIERAVGLQKLGRALVADAGHAGNIVRRVALQRLEVDQLTRLQPVFLPEHVFVVDDVADDKLAVGLFTAHAKLDLRLGRQQLQDVAVAADDANVDVLLFGLCHRRTDQVVGLVAVHHQDGDIERLDQLVNARHLLRQVIRHLVARAFVLAVQHVAPAQAVVKRHRQIIGLILAQDVEQTTRKAKDGAGRLAVAGGERVVDVGEMVAVGQRVTIDEVQHGT